MAIKEVFLPHFLNESGIYSLIDQMFFENVQPKSKEINIRFSPLRFAEPVGITSLANAVELALSHGCTVTFSDLDIDGPWRHHHPSLYYLDDSQFMMRYLGRTLNPNAKVRDTTLPIQSIIHSESHFWIENRFIPWLSRHLKVPTRSLASLKVCMQEIFNNIRDRSGREIGCIYAQYFPNKYEIQVAVSRFGIGIPTSIRRKFPDVGDDDQAILRATEDGVTAGSPGRNRGAGLDILLRYVVAANRGRVHMAAGRGCLNCFPRADGRSVEKRPTLAAGHYPGTLIQIVLRTDTFVADDAEEEDLTW